MKKALLFVGLMAIGIAPFFAEQPHRVHAEEAQVSTSTWTHVASTRPNPYTVDGETITETGNDAMRLNYYVTPDYQAQGDYSITTTIRGTMELPATKIVQAGIIPWYVDAQNYIICYMEWSNLDRPSQMREVQITGKIHNQNLVVWKNSSFVSSEWNDMWTDGRTTPPNSDITFKVEKKLSDKKDSSTFYAYINDQLIGFYGIRDVEQFSSEPVSIGVYGYNDTFTFENFRYENLQNKMTYHSLNEGDTGKASSGDWVYDVENASYTLSGAGSDWKENILLRENTVASDDYAFSSQVKLSNLKEGSTAGIMIYYKDEYNYLSAIVRNIGGELFGGFEGKITKFGAVLEVNEISTVDAISGLTLQDVTSLKVNKNGTNFKFLVNGEEKATYSNPFFTSYGKVGVVAASCDIVFSQIELISLAYIPFDWYQDQLGTSTEYYLSSYQRDAISYSLGEYVFSEAAFDKEDASKTAAVYYSSGRYDDVSIRAKFLDLNEASTIGLFGWLEDNNHYLMVKANKDGIVLENHFDDNVLQTNYAYPTSVSFGTEMELKVEVVSGLVTIYIGNEKVNEEAFQMEGYQVDFCPNVGILAGGNAAIRVREVSVDGYSSFQEVTQEDWKFYGARKETWTMDETGALTASCVGNTRWMGTNALFPNTNQEKNFYMASTIRVTSSVEIEWKTGIMPYYLDQNNYVFVWLSQWEASDTCVVVTAKLNGKVVGTEWREAKLGYQYFNEDNQLEVQIDEDTLSVYLNCSLYPSFTTEIEGLSNRNLNNSYVGMNISHTSATFKDNHFFSKERNYVMTEIPVIREIGTRKETGTLNKEVSLPIFTATNSNGDILNPVVKVYDPNQEEVEVKNNRFTPTKEGDYRVVVTCVDFWGNEAEPLEYSIHVTKEGEAPVNPENPPVNPDDPVDPVNPDNPPKKTNPALVICLSVVGGALVIGGGVTWFVLKNRKGKKNAK